jgi:hypothetical protein
MNRENRMNRPSAYRRLLGVHDDDPLSGVANLFDTAIVFALGFLLALITYLSLPELLSEQSEVTLVKNPGQPNMEIIKKKGITLEKYRMTLKNLGGEGVKLGTAYRLKSGEVVYVPEASSEESGETGQEKQK